MESRVTGNCHARFGAGENLEITSKGYLSLKMSTLQHFAGVAYIAYLYSNIGGVFEKRNVCKIYYLDK